MYNAFVDAFDKLQVALGILNVDQRPWWTHNARLWECGVDVSTVFAITNMKNPTKESSHQNIKTLTSIHLSTSVSNRIAQQASPLTVRTRPLYIEDNMQLGLRHKILRHKAY